MKLGKDPGDTTRAPASFHTAVSRFFGEYQQQGTEPAVTKKLQRRREKKDKQYKGGMFQCQRRKEQEVTNEKTKEVLELELMSAVCVITRQNLLIDDHDQLRIN